MDKSRLDEAEFLDKAEVIKSFNEYLTDIDDLLVSEDHHDLEDFAYKYSNAFGEDDTFMNCVKQVVKLLGSSSIPDLKRLDTL